MTIQLDNLSRPARRSMPVVDRGTVRTRDIARPAAPERFRPRVPARRRPPAGVVAPRPVVPPARRAGCEDSRREGYRLGRWARLAITVSVFVTALLFATGALPNSSAVDSGVTVEVSVEPGDTLWSIAQNAAPGENTGAVVERIRELNGLADTGALPAGLVLVVPAG